MTFRDVPIRSKLVIIILATAAAVMVLMGSLFFAHEFVSFRRTTLRQLSTVGHVLAANSTAALAFANSDDATEVLGALRSEEYLTAAALYDRSGKLFARYPANFPQTSLPAKPGEEGYHYDYFTLAGFQRVMKDNNRLGALYLQLDSGATMRDWLRGSIGIAIGAIAVAFIVAYLISQVLQRQISQPILALADTATAISQRRDFSVRANPLGKDELGLLTNAFNQMLSEIEGQDRAIRVDITKREQVEQELQELNAALEERVAARTAELEASNKELEAFSYSEQEKNIEMEKAIRAKDRFLATMSHELRTPLNAIIGFTGTLLMELPGPLTGEQRRQLETVKSSARHQLSLINDLLDLAKIESGKVELKLEPVDCGSVVKEVADTLSPLAKEKGLRFDMSAPEGIMANTDRRALNQILINLVNNAIKFTEKGGVRIDLCKENGSTRISVIDTGVGIGLEDQAKLFGAFSRLEASGAGRQEGTGLGLHLSQKLAELLGTRVTFSSEPGHGSTFTLALGLPAPECGPGSDGLEEVSPKLSKGMVSF